MSTMQRLTLIGMYNYDSDLFTNLSLPTGYDTQTFINSLLLEHGEKCVMYPDVDFMKFAIGAFSSKWSLELDKIYKALTADYNPIENYDRHEDIDISYIRGTTSTTSAKYDHDRTADLKDTSNQLSTGSIERQVSAFNESTYQPSEKTIENAGKSEVATTGTDKVHVEGEIGKVVNTGTDTTQHDAHIHGNIGVTTAAKMVSEVVEQRMQKNLYEIATRIFANELLIQIY